MVRPEPQVITRATASPGPATGSRMLVNSNGMFGPRSSMAFIYDSPTRGREFVGWAKRSVPTAANAWARRFAALPTLRDEIVELGMLAHVGGDERARHHHLETLGADRLERAAHQRRADAA